MATYDLPIAGTMMLRAAAPEAETCGREAFSSDTCGMRVDGPAATSSGLGSFLRESRSVFRLTSPISAARPFEAANRAISPGPRRPLATLGMLIILSGVALLALALALWPSLPPVNQDEYLPLLPMSWITKTPAARSTALDWYSTRLFGHKVPLRSYPYVGAVKGFLYAATSLPTSINVYRAAKLFLVWVLFGIVLWTCFRLSGGSLVACATCLVLLLSDIPLIVLGITDAGTQYVSLVLGSLLFGLLYSVMESPRWWKLFPIGLVVFLGEWDRVNFLWFIGASLIGCTTALLARPLRTAPRVLAISGGGCVLGLLSVAALIPNYVAQAKAGAGRSIAISDMIGLWNHWTLLFERLDPFGAYHSYVNVSTPDHPGLYAVYRWSFALLYVAVAGACAGLGIAHLRRKHRHAMPMLFLAAFLASLLAIIVKTADAWGAHHIVVVKPFAYIGLGILAGELSRVPRTRMSVTTLSVLVALGLGYICVRGYLNTRTTPPILGIYDVSWNAVEAWQAAARSNVSNVYALDWGVFYPGVVTSPADQRWEMTEVETPEKLLNLSFGKAVANIGLLFRASGPHRWLLSSSDVDKNYVVVEQRMFGNHKGEKWVFLIVNTPGRRNIEPPTTEPPSNLVRNPAFREGEAYWQYEKWEKEPGNAELAIVPCGPTGTISCAQITHRGDADSRIIQEIHLAPNAIYEITAWAKARGVGERSKGVHLCLMSHLVAESGELRGDTDWHQLRFYVSSLKQPRRMRLAARLGTYGQINSGTAWFTAFAVREVAAPAKEVRVHELSGKP